MPVGQRVDPFKNHRFLVEVDGITQAGFREVTIPDSTQDPVEYRNGDETTTVRKLPGLTKYGNVSLKWGITDSLELYEWHQQIVDGKVAEARKAMAIVLMNDEGEPAARWEFSQAWPTKYDAPDLNATANEIAIETLEIVHEGMRRTQ
jgi:phage tail-like protein